MARSKSKRKVSRATLFFLLLSAVLSLLLYRATRKPPIVPGPSPAPRISGTPRTRPPASRRSPPPPDETALPGTPRPAPTPAGRGARIAILIDDLGNDEQAVNRICAWPYAVSAAVLPALASSADTARRLERSGKQVILHLPMEPRGYPGVRPGPGVVLLTQTDAEILAVLASDLASVPGAAGVNNHMGSAATADQRVMRVVAEDLARRGLFFVDSRTTDATVARDAARAAGVPNASRRVFLDDVATEPAVQASLEGLVRKAKSEGSAIAIGHPHPATLAVLDRELPRLADYGVRLVRVSELLE